MHTKTTLNTKKKWLPLQRQIENTWNKTNPSFHRDNEEEKKETDKMD